MPFGNVNITIQDGGLGAAPPSGLGTPVVIGWSSLGSNFTLTQYGSIASMIAGQGYGEAVELASFILAITGAPVWFLRIPANGTTPTQGLVSLFATGTSVVTITGTPIDNDQIVVNVITGGTISTADGKQIQVSRDNGRTFGPTVNLGSAATYKIPTINGVDPVGWTLNFGAGTLVAGESCSVAVRGPQWAVADVATALTQLQNQPASVQFGLVFPAGGFAAESDAVSIDSSMVAMAAVPRFARLIGYAQGWFDQTIAINAMTGTTTVTVTTTTPHGLLSGMVVTIAGAGGITNVNGVQTITRISATQFSFTPSPAASGAYTSGGTVTQTEANWVSQLTTQWSAFTSIRTGWCAGSVNVTSKVGGPAPTGSRLARRPNLFPIAQRAVQVQPSRDLAAVEDGALTGCAFPTPSSGDTNVYHDERVTPGLDAAGFSTLWTYPDLAGVFVKNARLFAPPGSDYIYLQYGRVMDAFSLAMRQYWLKRLSSNVRLNPSTGFILTQDATTMQKEADSYCTTQVVNPGWASAVQNIVSTTDPLSTTKTVTVTGKCIPLGYIKDIEITLSFAAQLFTGGAQPTTGAT